MFLVLTENFEMTCRYPFRVLSDLVKAIAEKEGVDKDHIVITGGSTEGLKTAGLIYGRDEREIIAEAYPRKRRSFADA